MDVVAMTATRLQHQGPFQREHTSSWPIRHTLGIWMNPQPTFAENNICAHLKRAVDLKGKLERRPIQNEVSLVEALMLNHL